RSPSPTNSAPQTTANRKRAKIPKAQSSQSKRKPSYGFLSRIPSALSASLRLHSDLSSLAGRQETRAPSHRRHVLHSLRRRLQLPMIDDLPTVARAAGPLPLDHPQEISPPIAIDGATESFAADCFAFTAQKGQRISIDAVAGRLGSKLDPVLRLLDSAGRELA